MPILNAQQITVCVLGLYYLTRSFIKNKSTNEEIIVLLYVVQLKQMCVSEPFYEFLEEEHHLSQFFCDKTVKKRKKSDFCNQCALILQWCFFHCIDLGFSFVALTDCTKRNPTDLQTTKRMPSTLVYLTETQPKCSVQGCLFLPE